MIEGMINFALEKINELMPLIKRIEEVNISSIHEPELTEAIDNLEKTINKMSEAAKILTGVLRKLNEKKAPIKNSKGGVHNVSNERIS